MTAGNTIYLVHVSDSGTNIGTYTITTGPNHPSGAGMNVLYGSGFPGTSYNTIRSYTTGTDYIQISGASSTNTVVPLYPYAAISAIGTTGVRTTYTLPGPPTTPDMLTITQDVNVRGTTFENSYVEITTTVTNNGTSSVNVGIRYLWDMEIVADDGPTFQAINPDGNVLTTESEFIPPNFVAYQIVDNDVNPSPPTFIVFGTATGPTSLVPRPNTPNDLKYVGWGTAFSSAFDYTINPNRVIADTNVDNDSAVLYYWGQNSNSAIVIPAGGSITRSASLFSTKPGVAPPFINDTACIQVIRVFDSCYQTFERTTSFYLPCLDDNVTCDVSGGTCQVLRVSEPDSEGNVQALVRAILILELDTGISFRRPIRRVFTYTTTVTLNAPTGSRVSCEIGETSCTCEPVQNHTITCTIQANIIARSKGLVYLEVPYISLCEPTPCNSL